MVMIAAALWLAACQGSGLGGLNDTKVNTNWKDGARQIAPEETAQTDQEKPADPGPAESKPSPTPKPTPQPQGAAKLAVMIGPQVLLAADAGDAVTSRAAVLSLAPPPDAKPSLAANTVFLPRIEEMTP
jgi:hypothetical protein